MIRHVLLVLSGAKDNFPYLSLESTLTKTFESLVTKVTVAEPGTHVEMIARQQKPDLIIVFTGFYQPPATIRALRQEGFCTAVWFIDDPYYTDVTSRQCISYDYVFTQDSHCVQFYHQLGCENVFHLPLAVDTALYYPNARDSAYASDLCFVGNGYGNRVDFFDSISTYLANKSIYIIGSDWNRLKSYNLLKNKIVSHWVCPEQVSRYYSNAKIVINVHRSHLDTKNMNSYGIQPGSINNRLFEVAGCKSFQITDTRPDLELYFKKGIEIETFQSSEEFIDKVEYYLNHSDKRQKVADKGYDRSMKEHTYHHRISKLLSIVETK